MLIVESLGGTRVGRHRLRGLCVALVAVFVMAGSTSVGAAPALADARTPATAVAGCSPGVPAYDCAAAISTYEFVTTHNYSPRAGMSGGKVYRNGTGELPAGGDYREFDIYPRNATGRTAERLVIDVGNPAGNSWYTPQHFAPGSFVQFYVVV